MKKFVFKLEPVLDMKKRNEEEVQVMLGMALADLQVLKDELDNIYNKKNDCQNKMEKFKASMCRIDELLTYQNYVESVVRQMGSLKVKILEMEKKVEEVRKLLAQAAKERKMIEKMKEKEFEKYQKELRTKEINFLDEIGVLRETRKMLTKK